MGERISKAWSLPRLTSDIGRSLLLLVAVMLFPAKSYANQGFQGMCSDGGVFIQVVGISSTNAAQGSFPGCTVTVFIHGTVTLASIARDNSGTGLSNPFTASNSDGSFLFYAANGRYDIQVTAPGLNFTYTDILFNDPAFVTIGAVFVPTTRADRQSILQNPDFEGSNLLPPPGWSLVNGSTQTVSYEIVSPAPGKLQSVKIATTLNTNEGITTLTSYSVFPGDTYALSVMAKTDVNGIASAALAFYDKNHTFLSNAASQSITSTTWTQLTGFGTVPANAVQMAVVLLNSSATQPSTVWFDQVEVRQTNFVGPIAINPPSSGTGLSITNAFPVQIALNDTITGRNWQIRNGGAGSAAFDIFDAQDSKTLIWASSSEVRIGTSTNIIGNASRLYVFGGANGANVDIQADGTTTDQVIVELEGSDYATHANSMRTEYQGINATGTTSGFTNVNLGQLICNATCANMLIGSGTGSTAPVVFVTNSLERMRLLNSYQLNLGVNGAGSGILGFNGSVSGTATLTSPAVAGTVSNPILSSNALQSPLYLVGGTDTGISRGGSAIFDFGNGTATDVSGTVQAANHAAMNAAVARSAIYTSGTAGFVNVNSTGVVAFTSTTTGGSGGTVDSGLSRLAAASVAVGNGTNGDASGTLKDTITNAVTGYQINGTATNGHCLVGNGTNYVDNVCSTIAGGINVQIFTSSGTFTIPAGVANVKATVIGGGGGGGATSGISLNGGGGGCSGGTGIKWLTGLTPGNTITVTVGTAGAGGTAGGNGGAGADSSIASGTQTITTVTGRGGSGGAGGSPTALTGCGGINGTGGDIEIPSADGSNGFGTANNGLGGDGGQSTLGSKVHTAPSTTSSVNNGTAGSVPGGGGSGGSGNATTAATGGAGAAGIVFFEWVH